MIVGLLVGIIIALAMFLMGLSIQALKKLVKVLTTFICNGLNKIGINLRYKDRNLKVDESVKKDYTNLKEIKRGALGMKKKSSINIFALILFFISLSLIIANLNALTGNVITNWLNDLMLKINLDIGTIDMNTIFTAAVFSVLSFSFTKLLSQWKETSDIRKEKRHQKRKKKLLEEMTSVELITEAEKKDKEKINGGKS